MRTSAKLAFALGAFVAVAAAGPASAAPAQTLAPLKGITVVGDGLVEQVHRRGWRGSRCHWERRCYWTRWGHRRCHLVRRCGGRWW